MNRYYEISGGLREKTVADIVSELLKAFSPEISQNSTYVKDLMKILLQVHSIQVAFLAGMQELGESGSLTRVENSSDYYAVLGDLRKSQHNYLSFFDSDGNVGSQKFNCETKDFYFCSKVYRTSTGFIVVGESNNQFWLHNECFAREYCLFSQPRHPILKSFGTLKI